MFDEQAQRKTDFHDGINVTLSDGYSWTLPVREPLLADPEVESLLEAIGEAESQSERLQLELAFTILLLCRNYQLSADQIQHLLHFSPQDPALAKLREAVRGLADRSSIAINRVTPNTLPESLPSRPTITSRNLGMKPSH